MKRVVKFSLSGLIGAIMIALLVGVAVMAIAASMGTGGNLPMMGLVAACISFGFSLIPGDGKTKSMALMAVQKEIWTNYLDENLYADNSFLEETMDHSEYVDNLTVHSPQAGDDGEVVENRSVFPATVTSRTDTTVDWNINEYTVTPWKISNAEEVELSYNKLESMLYSRRAYLDQKIADGALYSSAPTGTAQLRNEAGVNNNILRSSGIPNNDPTAVKLYLPSYLPGSAGYRYTFGLYDVLQAKLSFDNKDIPAKDRHMIVSANALQDIIRDITATKYRDSLSQFNTAEGTVDRLMGFTFHTRSKVVRYNNAPTPVAKAPTAAAAADDNDAILFWHKMSLRRAKGETKVYEDGDRAEYFGKLFSLLKRFGMSISRNDELGVGAIVQAAYVPGGN